jgi:hypothetical protein
VPKYFERHLPRRAISTETIEITFAIPNRVFTSRRLSFQNAPDLCSLKLHREMAGSVDNPLKAHYRISDSELDDYHNSHLPKSAKGLTHVSRHKVSNSCRVSFSSTNPSEREFPVLGTVDLAHRLGGSNARNFR